MSDPKRILIVDDNRSLVRVTEGVLHRHGFEIITAYDGPEGLQRAQAEKPDLIILDIVMPSMSGYEVCRRLQENPETSAIPVLMLTVKGQVDDAEANQHSLDTRIRERMKGYEVGALDFISKPVNRPYLQLAQRLSEMSVEKLRMVAEGLLEITL